MQLDGSTSQIADFKQFNSCSWMMMFEAGTIEDNEIDISICNENDVSDVLLRRRLEYKQPGHVDSTVDNSNSNSNHSIQFKLWMLAIIVIGAIILILFIIGLFRYCWLKCHNKNNSISKYENTPGKLFNKKNINHNSDEEEKFNENYKQRQNNIVLNADYIGRQSNVMMEMPIPSAPPLSPQEGINEL